MTFAALGAAVWLAGLAAWVPVCIGLSVWVGEKEPAKVYLGGALTWSFLMIPVIGFLAIIERFS